MKEQLLPGTDIQVPVLALGCWGLTSDFHWGQRDASLSKEVVKTALDEGITFFDTAAMYAEGASESLLGEILPASRDKVLIATKSSPNATSAADVRENLEASLKRLQTDYVDLYQIHWAGTDEQLADVWGGLVEAKAAGKTRAIGVCNLGPKQLEVVSAIQTPTSNQLPYNLLFRAIELDILPVCQKNSMGVLAYSPLMHGMLRGQWTDADQVPVTRARSRHFSKDREHARHQESGHEKLTFETIECLQQFAEVSHHSLVELSIGWLASRQSVSSILVGASSPDQVRSNVAIAQKQLDADLVAQLDQVTDPLKEALGSNIDLWQSGDASRVH